MLKTTVIIISCFLADGTYKEPRGEYHNFSLCNHWVHKFENETFPAHGSSRPLCWCHRATRAVPPLPVRREAPAAPRNERGLGFSLPRFGEVFRAMK